MIEHYVNRTGFPANLESYVNVQRMFFDSFVGQTFKVFAQQSVTKFGKFRLWREDGQFLQ